MTRRSGTAGQPRTTNDGRESPGVVRGGCAAARQSGVLHQGLRSPVGQGVSRSSGSTRHVSILDPTTGGLHSSTPVFGTHHPSSAMTRTTRCGSRAAVRVRAPGGSTAGSGKRRRRRQGAGLGPVGARHQRQRQGRRMDRARTSRSMRPRTSASAVSGSTAVCRRHRPTARCGVNALGPRPGVCRALRSAETQLTEIYAPPKARAMAARGGRHRSATACLDVAGGSGTSRRASTAASARARSAGRWRRAITVPRGLPCTGIRGRGSRVWRAAAPRRAITRGSITTTRSAWATTFRSPLPTCRTASSRSRTDG